MDTISLEESKKISLNILKYVDKLCLNNGLKYYLGYGTLLGAVRHKGFIPWDDDIDIIMFRDDYTKLIDLMDSLNHGSKYKLLSFEKRSYYLPYAKMVDMRTKIINDNFIRIDDLGIGIDIFPYDFIDDSKDKAQELKRTVILSEKLMRYSLYNNMRELDLNGLNIGKKSFYFLAHVLKWNKCANIYTKRAKIIRANGFKEYCGVIASFNNSVTPVVSSNYFTYVDYIEFEGIKFPVPKQYHEYLTDIYGDYMQLPPVEKRMPHATSAYFKYKGEN